MSLHVTHVFPKAFPHAINAWYVSSEVSGILTTSSNFITGTGLKKCNPPNLSFLLVTEAISPIDNELVFEAKSVLGGAISSKFLKSLCFISMFSTIASTTKSQSWTASLMLVVPLIRFCDSVTNFWAAWESSLWSFLATRARFLAILSSAFLMRSGWTSTRVTLWPVWAATWNKV